MRVALDAAPFSVAYGGIRRYVAELTRALAVRFPEDQYFLCTDRGGPAPGDLPALPNVTWVSPSPPWLAAKWWSIGLPLTLRRLGAQVFHGTDFAIPYWRSRPSVITVHDLSPWREPPVSEGASDRVRRRGPGHIRRADWVLTPTQAIASEAVARFGLDPSRVAATPLGVTPLAPGETSAVVPERPYFLYVGSRGPRKNLNTLLQAWEDCRGHLPGWSLVLAGGGRAAARPGVVDVGNPTDTELAAILSAATAFVYPSYYEGFGLPVLEAMAAGLPIITSQDPALREVSADAALHVPANGAAGWASALRQIANDAPLRKILAANGQRRAAGFTWERTAELTHSTYVDAIRSA